MTVREAVRNIKKNLQPKIDAALTDDVFRTVRNAELKAIWNEVYEVYAPEEYNRRMNKGGMLDPDNVQIAGGAAKDGVLTVVNTTPPNPDGVSPGGLGFVTTDKDLPSLIEFGHRKYTASSGRSGYDWPLMQRRYYYARPFTAETVRGLLDGGYHIKQMKRGLQRRGVHVK